MIEDVVVEKHTSYQKPPAWRGTTVDKYILV